MKPIFLLATQPNGQSVAFNIEHIKCVVAFEGSDTMVYTRDSVSVAIRETVEDFVNSANDI